MATVNAAREEFEAAKALRAAGKVPKEAVIRVFVILLDILIVVLLEKTTHEPELRSAAVTDGQERAGSKGPKPNRQMGDNLRKTIVEETVAACDACGADGPVDRERRTTSCSRSSSAAPRNARSARPEPRAGSPKTSRAVRHRHPSSRHQPAGRPDAVPAPSRSCRRSPASSSPRPRLCFHDASWEEAAVAHLLQRPMSTISDQRQVAPCRGTLTCKFPHRKRGREARDRHHPVLQGRPDCWASYMGQCSHEQSRQRLEHDGAGDRRFAEVRGQLRACGDLLSIAALGGCIDAIQPRENFLADLGRGR